MHPLFPLSEDPGPWRIAQPSRNIEDGEHALTVGMLAGLAMSEFGSVSPIVNAEGDYTDAFTIQGQTARYLVRVTPVPI